MIMYNSSGKKIDAYSRIVGDGLTDDSYALQYLIDNNDAIEIPSGLTIKLGRTINIDIGKTKLFDGGNSTFILSGDFVGFNLTGTASSGTATPASQNDQVTKVESGFIFKNCRILSASKTDGTGINITGCFNISILSCYIALLKNGITIHGFNRDFIISNNNIYGIQEDGIYFGPTVNLHQVNICSNMIQYCYRPIHIDQCIMIANFQICGNDIEIAGTYPSDNTAMRCVLIESGDTNNLQLSELVITGNTIQGHSSTDCIIEIKGGANRLIRFVSIVGNHISNTLSTLINLQKAINVTISANTFFTDNSRRASYAIDLKDCKCVSVSGNSVTYMGHLLKTSDGTSGVSVTGNSSYVFDDYTTDNTESSQTIVETGNVVEVMS